MLTRVIDRLRLCAAIDEVVVATTANAEDDPILPVAQAAGARCYRGSPHDVLARYVGAAAAAQADVVVRVTADCPLIDPTVVDRVLSALDALEPSDYASNVIRRSFPRGLDAEALYTDCLLRIDRLAQSRQAREHVTWFAYRERPDLFVLRSVIDPVDNSDLRWTVDTEDDLRFVRAVHDELDKLGPDPTYLDLVAHIRAHPNLRAINAHVPQQR
jgi:spore coat polysaccharide biosynthesis protein SpsF